MDKGTLSVIQSFTNEMRERGIDVSRIVLFGSYHEGTATGDSDLDLAVISQSFIGMNTLERLRLVKSAVFSVIDTYDLPLDLILLTPDEYTSERSLRMSFIRQGREIMVPA
jgi:predicted nucleotidyltransferase